MDEPPPPSLRNSEYAVLLKNFQLAYRQHLEFVKLQESWFKTMGEVKFRQAKCLCLRLNA